MGNGHNGSAGPEGASRLHKHQLLLDSQREFGVFASPLDADTVRTPGCIWLRLPMRSEAEATVCQILRVQVQVP